MNGKNNELPRRKRSGYPFADFFRLAASGGVFDPLKNKYPNLVKIWIILVVLLLSCDTQNSTTNYKIDPESFAIHDQIKLITTQEGMYLVSLSELGWGEDAIDGIAITHKGQPVPFWVEEKDSGLEIIFFGQPPDSIYTPKNAYILQRNLEFVQKMSSPIMPDPEVQEVNHFTSCLLYTSDAADDYLTV